jgi:hypothetical protein
MAIPFLNNINLSDNELQNAKLHVTSSAPTEATGQIYYNSSSNVVLVYDNAGWETVAFQSWATDQFLEDSQVTAFAKTILDDANASAVRTTIGVDAAGTDNSTNVTLATVANNYLSISGQAITAGTVPISLGGTGATTAAAARTALGVDAAGTDNSTNVSLAGAYDYITAGGTNNQTLTLGQITNDDLENSSITVNGSAISLGGSVNTLQLGTTSSTALAGDTTVDDVSIANLKTRLAGGFGSDAVQIGDSNDTVTIPGNLVVTGTQTISNETVQVVENNTILFEGATDDNFETKLTVEDPTADRVITLPDATGTVALTTDLVGQITKKISGDGSATSFNVTHNFGTPIVSVTLLDYGDDSTGATYEQVYADVVRNSDNAVTISFATAPSGTQDYLALISKFPAIS